MRSISSALTTAFAGDSITLITLIEIGLATPVYRALWNEDVTFDGVTYTSDVGGFGSVTHSIQGTRPRFVLSLQNVTDGSADLPWTTTIGASNLNGTEVKVRWVEESLLADTAAVVLEEQWYISGYETDRQFIRFGLGSPHDALAFEVPRVPVGGKTCMWRYKQGPCTSTSSHATCGKTLGDCMKRFDAGKPLPFGPSFPFMSRQSRGRR